MLTAIAPASIPALAILVFCFVLVLAFEASNGFHDTANAVATVIYTHSLKPVPAVLLSGALNFAGVMLGGLAVAYALVELLPPDTLTPPDGNPAIAMLLALFLSALTWNIITWWRGIPCSSSHAIIGALLGVATASALLNARDPGRAVDWGQAWSVLQALLISPVLGFIFAGGLFWVSKKLLRDPNLYEPAKEGRPPAGWVRGLLILTCSGVSFAHGSNDGQKSIGLIMLTVIGIMPAQFALNFNLPADSIPGIAQAAKQAAPLIRRYGDDERESGAKAADDVADRLGKIHALEEIPARDRSALRGEIYRVSSELKASGENRQASADDRKTLATLHATVHAAVEYAPIWVRVLSALCLGIGTMVGYKRIVRTIGERIGKTDLVPAQGACAELVSAALIGTAGVSGLPVSTTHIVASGVAGTMAASGAGVQTSTLRSIAIAWILTLPATALLAAAIFTAAAML